MDVLTAPWLSERSYESVCFPATQQEGLEFQSNNICENGVSIPLFSSIDDLELSSLSSTGFQWEEGEIICNQRHPEANTWNSSFSQSFCIEASATSTFPAYLLQNYHQNFPVQQQQGLSYKQIENMAPRSPTNPGEFISSQLYAGVQDFQAVDSLPLENSRAVPKNTSDTRKDYVIAERKRRENLNQKFVALSAIVPGLKKLNKETVLAEAARYVKQLQERLNVLEEQAPKKTVQSVVYVNKLSLATEDVQASPKAIIADDAVGLLTPEIEARVVQRSFLIRIHCAKRKGLLVKVFEELEKLLLTVADASVLTFTATALELTFKGQMEEGCDLTVADIVNALTSFLKRMS